MGLLGDIGGGLAGLAASAAQPLGLLGGAAAGYVAGDAINKATAAPPVDPALANGYQYTPQSGSISPAWSSAESKFNKTAYNTPGNAAALNKGVDSQSNLMGPSSDDVPANQALNARSNQIYQSNISQIMRGAKPMAQQMSTQMETQDLGQKAAIFANEQAQAQMNYKQASFQRASAIDMANLQNQLYTTLFGSLAQTSGSAIAMATSRTGNTTNVNVSGYGGGPWTNQNGQPIDMGDSSNQPGGSNFVGPLQEAQ